MASEVFYAALAVFIQAAVGVGLGVWGASAAPPAQKE